MVTKPAWTINPGELILFPVSGYHFLVHRITINKWGGVELVGRWQSGRKAEFYFPPEILLQVKESKI